MDALAPTLGMPVVAQTGPSRFTPTNMDAHNRIAPDKFEKLVQQSRLIVSHAGIGTVLTAQRFGKPIILMPRRAELGEHRNDHQLATANKLDGRSGILVAMDQTELADRIADGLALKAFRSNPDSGSRQLRSTVARFIETGHL
nr:glycosyltransferase [Erythrobacter crassostrea]